MLETLEFLYDQNWKTYKIMFKSIRISFMPFLHFYYSVHSRMIYKIMFEQKKKIVRGNLFVDFFSFTYTLYGTVINQQEKQKQKKNQNKR